MGIAEKGFVTIELSTRAAGGHSSLPPRHSAVGIVSAAVARLEQSPMRARLEGPTRQLLDHIGPRFPLLQRALFANLWLTRPLVVHKLEESPATNAMVRTTTAVTLFQAGTKDNVLPSYARAVINFRILPGDSVATVMDHVRRTIDDKRVEIRAVGRFSAEPSAVSSTRSESFRTLEQTIRSVAPDAIVAPYLVVVVTDARYYTDLTRNVFRFLPLRLTSRDLPRMHGIDERIGIREYEGAIRTYRQLILAATGSEGGGAEPDRAPSRRRSRVSPSRVTGTLHGRNASLDGRRHPPEDHHEGKDSRIASGGRRTVRDGSAGRDPCRVERLLPILQVVAVREGDRRVTFPGE